MLTKTEAIVLKSMKYRDTSKIVTFYSKKFGKVRGIAKGARTMKNKFGSSLEPLSHSMLLIYKKENRDLHLISQCDAIDSFGNLTKDLDKMFMAFDAVGLVNKVAHEEEQNIGLFGLLLGMLGTLNLKNADYTTYILAFRLRLASLFGYMPDFNSCKKCGSRIDTGGSRGDMMFKISNGGVICDKCNGPGRRAIREREDGFVPLSAGALQISRKLMDLRWGSLGNLKYEKKIGNEIDDIIRLYLRYHFDGLQTIKSIENFQNNE